MGTHLHRLKDDFITERYFNSRLPFKEYHFRAPSTVLDLSSLVAYPELEISFFGMEKKPFEWNKTICNLLSS